MEYKCEIHGFFENATDAPDVCPICEYLEIRKNWECPKCFNKLKEDERICLHKCPNI